MDPKNYIMQDQYNRTQGAKLKVQNKKFSIYKGVNIIGRNKSAAVDLKNLNISQYHALITIVDDSQHFISDLNSSNGTYLFGTKLVPFKLYELPNETEVKFGDVIGLYLKMPNTNSTIHLESERMEATQNFSQTFYAAQTQVMFNESSLNQSPAPLQNNSADETPDIHEAATQVVQYPSTMNNVKTPDKNSVVTEELNYDIHNAPTQVIAPQQPSTSKASEVDIHKTATQLVPPLQRTHIPDHFQENIHEVATQVVTFPPDKKEKQRCENKPYINSSILNARDYSKDDVRKTDVSINQDSVIEGTVIEETVIEDSIIEEVTDNRDREINTDENSNDSVDFLTINKPPDIEIKQLKHSQNYEENLTPSDTQHIGRPMKRTVRKLSSSEDLVPSQNDNDKCNSDSETDIEDMDIEKLKKNESDTKPPENNVDSDTDDELLQKRNNQDKVVNSDSETDIENDGDPILPMTQSDDVIKPKILSKKLNFNSDSDTDVEDNKENELTKKVTHDTDSNATILNDTDYIPATQDAFANVFQYKTSKLSNSNLNSQNVSSEESFKLGLTELMVDENDLFDKSDKETEENSPILSRKLDQTKDKENISEMNEKQTQKVIDKETSDDDKLKSMTSTSKTGINKDEKELDEDLYMMPTQRISDQIQKEDSESTEDVRIVNTTLGPSKNVPDDNQHDDFYIMATQKINNQQHSTAIQDVNEGGTTLSVLNVSDIEKDDIYIMPTQKINNKQLHKEKEDPVQHTDQAKSTLPSSNVITDKEGERDDDFYMIPTQKISDEQKKGVQENNRLENSSDISKPMTDDNEDDDMYMMPTQKIDEAAFKVPQKFTFKKKFMNLDGSLTSILGNKPEDDPYSMGTQKMNEISDNKHEQHLAEQQQKSEKKNKIHTIQDCNDENELYLQATQELKHVSHSNKEKKLEEDPYMVPTQQIHQDSVNEKNSCKNSKTEAPRGKNYVTETQTELYMAATQKIDTQSTSDCGKLPLTDNAKDLYDVPTQPLLHNTGGQAEQLGNKKSDVEVSHLKRVGDTCTDVPKIKRVKKSNIESLKKTIEAKEKIEDAETLSQIEAFVKTPLESIKKVSKPEESGYVDNLKEAKRKELEVTETLSQIEAFVKNPVSKISSNANQNQTNKGTSSLSRVQNEQVETLSQIEAFVKQPLAQQLTEKEQSKETDGNNKNISSILKKTVPSKNITRSTRTRQSNITTEKEMKEKIKDEIPTDQTREGNKEVDDEKLAKVDKNINTSNAEADVKSDIDQSFALLEAKSTKTRKSQRVANVGEVKVTLRKNRRSMTTSSISELSENDNVRKKTTTRKSRRVLNNNIEQVPSERTLIDRSLQKKDAQTEHKSEDYDSDFSEPEIPAKKMKKGVTKKGNTKEKVNDNTDNKRDVKVSRIVELPKASTSNTRASTRKGNTKNSGDITEGSSDAESISSKNLLLKPSKIDTDKKIYDNLENKDISTPSTSKARASSRMKKLNSSDNSSWVSSSSNDSILVTPSRRGRSTAPSDATLIMSERSKRKQRPKVVFTMLDNPQLESLIRQLGGTVVNSVDSSTVLVTEHVKRSQKLLTAVGQGKPVCSPNWIYASKKANEFLDPWDYILVDKEAESKWNFSLKESITRAAREKLLTNYTFQIMVNAAVDVLKGAIEACGGKYVTRNPPKNMEGYIVAVASPENRTKYLKMKKQNPEVTVVEPEAIFDGVLRQELRLGRHLLT